MELIRRDVKMIDIQILFATSDPSLPLSYSGLTSFDYGKEVGLFESDDFNGLNKNLMYYLITFDLNNEYNAVIHDYIIPK